MTGQRISGNLLSEIQTEKLRTNSRTEANISLREIKKREVLIGEHPDKSGLINSAD